MNSTPVNWEFTMRPTALPPPPPSPITLILAICWNSSSSKSGWSARSFIQTLLSEGLAEPGGHALEDGAGATTVVGLQDGPTGGVAAKTVQGETHAGGVDGTAHHVGQAADAGGGSAADGLIE